MTWKKLFIQNTKSSEGINLLLFFWEYMKMLICFCKHTNIFDHWQALESEANLLELLG